MKIAVAITGASGSIYAQQLLSTLHQLKDKLQEVHIVWTSNAQTVWQEELGEATYDKFAFPTWDNRDFYAPFASGSAGFDALIICPCSMGTLGRIAAGISDNLITRAADVMLKERKKLICVIRENPYNLIHINNMKTLTEAGGIICPASPSFYHRPASLAEATQSVIDKIIQLLGIDHAHFRWGGPS